MSQSPLFQVDLHKPLQRPDNDDDEPYDDDDTMSISSVDSVIAPPDPIRNKLLALAAILGLVTLGDLFICCVYSYISGRASYYYAHPKTWQFCLLYSDTTISSYDQKLIDNVPTILSNMGLQNCFFSWLALGASWRALYHHEWIPSTITFLAYNILGLLVYYQSTPLIMFPAAFVTTLVSATKYLTDGLYGRIGRYCFMFQYRIKGFIPWTDYYPELSTNCTDSIVLVKSSLQYAETPQDKLVGLASNTVPESDLNCDGATALNYWFLAINYFFVLVSVGLLALMLHAEFYRQKHKRVYKQRYLIRGTHEEMQGTKLPRFLLFLTAGAFFIEMIAKQVASCVSINSTKMWPLIDLTGAAATDLGGTYVDYRYDMQFSLNGWLPFKKTYINIQTILVIATTMSIVRGVTRQSVSAFRLASLASALFVVTMWPITIGNMQNMATADLWPWQDDSKCYDYFSGVVALYPTRDESKILCTCTRLAVFASLVTFISMHFTILACARVFVKNKNRLSLTEMDLETQHYEHGGPPEPTPIYNIGINQQSYKPTEV